MAARRKPKVRRATKPRRVTKKRRATKPRRVTKKRRAAQKRRGTQPRHPTKVRRAAKPRRKAAARKRGRAPRRRAVTVSLQIVPRKGDDLLGLVKRWVETEAQTLYFTAKRPKLRLEHRSPRFKGHIELVRRGNLLLGEARAPGGVAPWGVVEKFVGRVIDKLSHQISSVNIQMNEPD